MYNKNHYFSKKYVMINNCCVKIKVLRKEKYAENRQIIFTIEFLFFNVFENEKSFISIFRLIKYFTYANYFRYFPPTI